MPHLLTDATLNGAFSNYQQPRFFELRPPAGRACVIHGDCLPGKFVLTPKRVFAGCYYQFLDNGGSEYQGKLDLNAARKSTPVVLRYTSHHPHEHPPSINLPRSCEAAPHKPICDATDVPDEFVDRIG